MATRLSMLPLQLSVQAMSAAATSPPPSAPAILLRVITPSHSATAVLLDVRTHLPLDISTTPQAISRQHLVRLTMQLPADRKCLDCSTHAPALLLIRPTFF